MRAERYISTIGVDFKIRPIDLDGTMVKPQTVAVRTASVFHTCAFLSVCAVRPCSSGAFCQLAQAVIYHGARGEMKPACVSLQMVDLRHHHCLDVESFNNFKNSGSGGFVFHHSFARQFSCSFCHVLRALAGRSLSRALAVVSSACRSFDFTVRNLLVRGSMMAQNRSKIFSVMTVRSTPE